MICNFTWLSFEGLPCEGINETQDSVSLKTTYFMLASLDDIRSALKLSNKKVRVVHRASQLTVISLFTGNT